MHSQADLDRQKGDVAAARKESLRLCSGTWGSVTIPAIILVANELKIESSKVEERIRPWMRGDIRRWQS